MPTPAPAAASSSAASKKPGVFFNTIRTYGWDETTAAVKIYVSLDGVEALDPANIQVQFVACL